jgi:signal transduction histidine kinase
MSAIDSPRARDALAAAWLVFATVNAVLMYLLPGKETIPYHLIWASFALLYGLFVWPRLATRIVFAAIVVATGVPLVQHARDGIIGWEECSEIVLMAVIAALLVWHVDRAQAARAAMIEFFGAEQIRAGNRELATRFGSHELRTRLSIARGLVELISDTSDQLGIREDAALAVRELDKATALTTSLMTLVRVDGVMADESLDLDELIDAIVRRWKARADRVWTAVPAAGYIRANPERLEAVIDCLIENAVKFTTGGDRICVDAHLDGRDVVIAVSDTGVGIPDEDIPLVTDLFHTSRNAGERAGNGLGLPIVRAAVESRGGTLRVASRLGEGTTVTIRTPRGTSAAPAAPTIHPPTSQTVHPSALRHADPSVEVLR